MPAAKDLAGRTLGDLRVIRRDQSHPGPHIHWVVACKCGSAPFSVRSASLANGITTRCASCAFSGPRKRGLYDGKTAHEWADHYGVTLKAIRKRLHRYGSVHLDKSA
jgi:hypothetical protein